MVFAQDLGGEANVSAHESRYCGSRGGGNVLGAYLAVVDRGGAFKDGLMCRRYRLSAGQGFQNSGWICGARLRVECESVLLGGFSGDVDRGKCLK